LNNLSINTHTPSRKKGTIALIISSYASLFLGVVKGLVLIPIYLYYIDDRLYGAWLATGSIVAYLGLFDFGLGGVLIQRVASNYGKRDFRHLGSILGTGLSIGLVLSFIPLFLGLLLSSWVPDIVKITGGDAEELRHAFIIAAVGTSLMLGMYHVGGVLTALQRQIVHGMLLVFGDILGIAVTVILLLNGYGLLAIPAGTLIWALISFLGDGLYLWWFIRKKMFQVSIRFKGEDFKDLFLHSVWQFGSRSAYTIARQSDNFIIAALIDPLLCTVFTLTKKASDMLALLVRHFIGAFLPGLAHLHGEDDREKLKNITSLLFKIASLSGVCFMGGYLFLNEEFVRLWVGSKYFGGMILTGLFCITAFFMILSTFFYNVIFAKGEIISAARANISEAIIRIPLSIFLVIFWGIKGAALASVVAILPTSFYMQAKSFLKASNFSKYDVLLALRIIGLQILVAFSAGIFLKSLWSPEDIVEFICFGVLYMVLVFSICVFLDKELFLSVLDIQRAFFKRKHNNSILNS
jgi:O-antigen/teichoic acid export membrane protein